MATVGSAIVAIIWKQPFLRLSAIVCDLRSAIVCDRLRLYGNQPLDRTWFYLLRSSAITSAGSQTIAEVFPYDRRRSQTLLRSAIGDHMETSLKRQDRKFTWDFYEQIHQNQSCLEKTIGCN